MPTQIQKQIDEAVKRIDTYLKDYIRDTVTIGKNEPLIRKSIRKRCLSEISDELTNIANKSAEEAKKEVEAVVTDVVSLHYPDVIISKKE